MDVLDKSKNIDDLNVISLKTGVDLGGGLSKQNQLTAKLIRK